MLKAAKYLQVVGVIAPIIGILILASGSDNPAFFPFLIGGILAFAVGRFLDSLAK